MRLAENPLLPTWCMCASAYCVVRWRTCLVIALLFVQACAADLARLPTSAFNASSRVPPDKKLTAAGAPVVAGTRQAQTPDVAMSDAFKHGSRAGLASDTDTLLQSYQYAEHDSSVELNGAGALSENPLPGIANSFSPDERVLPEPRYSLEVFDTPLHALLFSLAADAGVQLKVYGTLNARVTINAIDQILSDIMSTVAEQSDISWQLRDRVLTVWSGEAYSYSYPVNYLNIHRRTQSSVGLATQVGTINASIDSGASIANSSQTRVENISEHGFWGALDDDLQSIVNQSDTSAAGDPDFSINKEAGLLILYATPAIHRDVQQYLDLLQASSQRQVLIEATVVEVALSDSFDAGVDWQLLANGISGVSAAQVLVGASAVADDTLNRLAAPSGLVSLVQQSSNGDLRATLSFLEQFGDVRILSRPRIIALNNQSSVLKVVDNRVYFTVNVQHRQTEEINELVTETEIHTVPVGLVMNVTPQISQQGTVMLNVRPTLSRILGFVNDPNPELALANVQNGVPEIQVREMESMLQVRSGDVAILGGLMQETQADNNVRLPGLGALPGIGRLFSRQSRERRQTELLIVLRPTVLSNK